MNTLLEKAKKIPLYRNTRVTDQHVDLAIALLKGDVRYTGVKKALNISGGSNVYNFAFSALREAYRRGKIEIR